MIAFMLAGASSAAPAQECPAKPVTFFVPFAAGSATDTLARSPGQGVTAETKQNVVIDNRPGANGFIAAQAFFKATGIEPWITTSAELAKFQASESTKWAKVIRAAGIQPE